MKMKNKWYSIVGFMVVIAATTSFVKMPLPNGGYFNFGDVAVVFAGLFLGRKGGFLAGGVGSAVADIIGGYYIFAPLTFIAKAAEGYICGLAKDKKGLPFHIIPAFGTLTMVALYFIGELFMPQFGLAAATAELPFNLIQAGGAYIGGKLLFEFYNKVF